LKTGGGAMVEEKKKVSKAGKKKDKFVEAALKRYNQLLEMQKEFKEELKPLEQYLIKMKKIEKKVSKKKA
jgi:hypothetical protein